MKTIITENINSLQFIELRDYMQNMLKDSMKALDAHNVEDIDWYKDCTMNDYFQMWEEIWNDDVLVGEGIDTIAQSFVLNDNTRADFQNAFEQARNLAYEEYIKEMSKTIVCYFDYCELYAQAEGGWNGWYFPIWANITHDETDECIELTLGAQVSKNTSFIERDVHSIPKSWVGSIPTWNRMYGEDEAEVWAEDCGCSPDDYDPDAEVENEVNMWYVEGVFNEEIEKIKQNIIEYAKSEGYDIVEFC